MDIFRAPVHYSQEILLVFCFRACPIREEFFMKSQGQLASDISAAFNKLQKELAGKGPEDTKTYLINDMLIIRLKGVLTTEEKNLAQTETGKKLVKQLRQELRESRQQEFKEIIENLTGCHIVSSHSDISTKTGERIEIFILDQDLQVFLTD